MKNYAAAVKDKRKGDDFINGDQGGEEITEKENQIESTKAAICKVREENERLKTILAQIVRDYQSLQMHFFDIMKQEHAHIKPAEGHEPSSPANKVALPVHHEEHELVSLCLGSGSGAIKKQEDKTNFNGKVMNEINDYRIKEGITLGLECKMHVQESDVKNEVQLSNSLENSSEGTSIKEETVTGDQTWPASKATKSLKHGEDEVAPHAQVKKARVSVRARCDAPTMNDGCQWRKYGQKIAKGNPCPRAYYRCTVASGCPVRKQVQRCAEDMSILISTYEGNHNHPLPISATAMASTTAAAASMLISGSSSSLPGTALPHSATGLNFSVPDSSNHNGQFYITNPSISPALSQPTITLDLTNPSAATAYQPNRFLPSSSRSFYSQASFDFSHSELSSTWNSGTGYLGYGTQQPYYKSYNIGALRQSQESLFHPYAHKVPNPITDTIAKAITSDPSFQSALAAAITSYVGGSVAGAIGEGSSSSGVGGALKWAEQLPLASSLAIATTTMGNSGNLNCSTSSNLSKPQGSWIFPPSLGPSSSEKRPNGSPQENS